MYTLNFRSNYPGARHMPNPSCCNEDVACYRFLFVFSRSMTFREIHVYACLTENASKYTIWGCD